MPSFSDFKTYGAIMSAVGAYLTAGLAEAHKKHFGTPSYFVQRARMVHQAFDRFGSDHGLTCDETAALRSMIARHSGKYPNLSTIGVQVLCNELPDEFNMRGQWVSARAELETA